MVAEEERPRHVGKLLRVLLSKVYGGRDGVRDDVVHEGRATGAWVAKPHHLHTQWGTCKPVVTIIT